MVMLWHVNYIDKLFTRSVKLVVYEAHFGPFYRCLYSNKELISVFKNSNPNGMYRYCMSASENSGFYGETSFG